MVVLEKTLESPLDCKEIQPVHSEGDQPWVFIGRTDVDAETPILWLLTHLKRPWCWERLKAGGEGDDRGQNVWMASSTQWRWVWVNSGSWWWTGRPGLLQSMGSQSQTWLSDWTELNWLNLPYLTMSVGLKQKINLAMWVILSTIPRSKNSYSGVSLRRRHLNLQSFICSHS